MGRLKTQFLELPRFEGLDFFSFLQNLTTVSLKEGLQVGISLSAEGRVVSKSDRE